MLKNLFRTKPIAPAGHVDAGEPFEGSLDGEVGLKRTLTGTQLILLGIGAVIGAGIFVLTGQAAAEYAGPAVMLSFVLAGIACAFAGLCYAEFAAMLPVSGSAYSYSYATLGEGVAWFIGWCLVLEYLFAASTVAVGWSGYLNAFLGNFGAQLPDALASAPYVYEAATGRFVGTGALLNLPAVLIIAAVSGVGYVGISQSAFVNSIIVAIKVTVIVMFIGFGIQYVDPSNWQPFIPANEGGTRFGMDGVIRASAVVFFAYIGFDAVSTAAGEAKNPQRDMPIGILGSLAICTVLYIAMSAVLTGMMDFHLLGTPEPVSTALNNYPTLGWLQTLVEIAAIAGLASVILVMLMAQPRIFYSMSHDGLMPKMFGKVHPKYRTPYIGTVIVGVVAAVLGGLLPVGFLGDIVSMGTLLAFAVVSLGVLILRYTRPAVHRPFRVPFALLICPLGFLSCLYLFWQVFKEHWHLLIGWLVIGSGFFLLPASLAASGAITAFSWIIGTALALMLGGAFARLARQYPELSSADDYVRPALGRDASFLASTLYWASSWIGNNAIAVAAFGYLVMLLPLDGGNPQVQVAGQIALIWLMFAINLLGPKPVAKFQSLCVVFGLAPVALVLVFGWGSFDREVYDAAWNVSGQSDAAVVFGSLSPVFWAFVGLETGAMIAGLVRDPDRDVPRATLGGILIAGLVYIVSSVLVMGIVPAAELEASSAPFALVAAEIFGPWAAIAIAAAAALKATGTLGGWMLVTGETGARAAQHGYLPRIFGRMNRRGAAGWGLLIIAAAMSVIAMITLSPKVSGQFGVIINIVVNLVVLAYAAAGLSLVVGTRERRPTTGDRLLGIGALVACALLFASSSVEMMLGAAGAVALAWILYRIFGPRR